MAEGGYETTVFFIRNQGFVRATAARRISFEESLVFEQLHEQAYRDLGFRLVEVPAGPLPDRVALVRQTVDQLALGPLAGDRLRVRSLSHKNSRASGTTSPPTP